jgi:hypothetical protein
MARYSSFLGRRVEVQYRAGDILLPASGTFVADSGRSVFLEQSLVQRGQPRYFRWEIPYQYIVRLEQVSPLEDPQIAAQPTRVSAADTSGLSKQRAQRANKSGPEASAGVSPILPLRNRAKTA